MNGANASLLMKKKDLKREKEAGEKQRAGRLLSTFLRTIAQEKINVAADGEIPRMVTKARVLADQMWARALGLYQYIDPVTEVVKQPPPDKSMIELIFDRCEGKVGTHEEEKQKDANVPNKVSEIKKQHLNQLALESSGEKEKV